MRILFVSSELAPLAQSGGLGDAVAGLASALVARGHEVTCFVPGYRAVLASPLGPRIDRGVSRVALVDGDVEGRLLSGALTNGVNVTAWAHAMWDRSSLYGGNAHADDDNARRFIAFSRAAAQHVVTQQSAGLGYDVVVAHDWHAALCIALLRHANAENADAPARAQHTAAVQVVHNNAHQGRFDVAAMRWTGLSATLMQPDGIEAWGTLCLLKSGLQYADRIVAVSPTYADELQQPLSGEGLEGVYQRRRRVLHGITNGIDVVRENPSSDMGLPAHYDANDVAGKTICRTKLLDTLHLVHPPPGLLLAAVGRFAIQKGWDILLAALPRLLDMGASVVCLGDGDPAIARACRDAALHHPERVRVLEVFDAELARRVYAAADAIIVPSRFEPCGLVQLLAQRYGAVPIAHATGGLRDTIVDFRAAGVDDGSGYLFSPLNPDALIAATQAHVDLATRDLLAVQRRLLSLDVSWARAAARWEELLMLAVARRVAPQLSRS